MNWWLHSDGGLLARIVIGVAIFALLALADVRSHGPEATRWREYLFLLACVAAALLYGIVNDQITTTISWEYFAYGKGVAEILPAATSNTAAFRWEVAKIGMKATWSAGLIVGVALLLANNPRRDWPRLTYRQLARYVPLVFGMTALTAIVLGIAGHCGAFLPISRRFPCDGRRQSMATATFHVRLRHSSRRVYRRADGYRVLRCRDSPFSWLATATREWRKIRMNAKTP